MTNNTVSFCALAALILTAPPAQADIELTFEATVKAPTCAMSITGPSVTGSGSDFTLTVGTDNGQQGTVDLSAIKKKEASAATAFKLVAADCTSVTGISTRISGNSNSNNQLLLAEESENSTRNIAVGFYHENAPESWIKLNTDGAWLWSADEIAEGVNLFAALRVANEGENPVEGDFSAKAIFSFSYE
nr:fimbrial protein [uncultured Enterobacter sp.]